MLLGLDCRSVFSFCFAQYCWHGLLYVCSKPWLSSTYWKLHTANAYCMYLSSRSQLMLSGTSTEKKVKMRVWVKSHCSLSLCYWWKNWTMEDSSIGLSGTPVYELLLPQAESFSLLPSGGCQGTWDARTSEMDSQCPGLFHRRSSAS